MAEQVKTKHGGPLGWIRHHKKLTALLVVVLAAGLIAVNVLRGMGKASTAASYQFVRTTTLHKTDLTDSVSVNGTVKSGYEASVTAADSAKTYKVSQVLVTVGDTVKKGDVIALLDTGDLEDQIESAEQSYNDNLQSAQTSLDRAVDDLNTSTVKHENDLIDLQAKIEQADASLADAQDALTKAQENQRTAQSNYDTAVNNYNTVKSAYDSANASISSYTAALSTAASAQNQALTELNNAINSGDADAKTAAQAKFDEAQKNYQEAQKALANAQSSCSAPSLGLYGYDAISAKLSQYESEKDSAEKALDSAKSAVESAENTVDNCQQQVQSAHNSYDQEKNYSSLLSKSQNVEDSETKLEQASRTPDTLSTLRSTLDDCTLTATMDGTITGLNATVGSVCSGTVATIQNTNSLVVEVTIPASSVSKLSTGMQCNITSDATGDAVITGTLTQIDPVANDSGSFGGKVVVSGEDTGLLIGISAKVEVVISKTDDVFTVPIDAVGTAEDGSSYVLRRTGGEGVDMTFEQVPVTTGASNDYYIEISGSELNENDVIRSSADLTQGIETSDSSDGLQMMEDGSIYVGDGENMPDGVTITRTDEGGGPGGGGPGGPGGQG